ncbi:alpha/beta hydrolase-fold protein [Orenia marismortui]|uniref:alpha/beta hydrolase-fold protein n=1 Tax=Orenia marismortui TaxID=46469 RepID=UPI000372E398|nr:alpha/beta hydrolase-fold protein [Orenia marismortui]
MRKINMIILILLVSVLLLMTTNSLALAQKSDELYSVTFKVTVPKNTPLEDNIYVVGDFNEWPDKGGMKLTRNEDYTYSFTLTKAANTIIQYKFTRGDWSKVEEKKNGKDIHNRVYTFKEDNQVVELKIGRWTDLGNKSSKGVTVGDKVNSISTVTFKVTVPNNTPLEDNIYAAGTFNDWPDKGGRKLNRNEDYTYSFTLTKPIGNIIQYKLTRGDWSKVEVQENGTDIYNRMYTFSKEDQTVEIKVARWADLGRKSPKVMTIGDKLNSTVSGNIKVVKKFNSKKLDRKPDIQIYLPSDYNKGNKRYPVLYMQDGQNLFDNTIADDLEWKADETAEKLFKKSKIDGIIIVGVNHAESNRSIEYSPWTDEPYINNAMGDKYLEFLVEELKPYIDKNYRTLSDRENTGIAGSEMGALISFYGGLKYQNVFSKIGAFSPAFWIANGRIYDSVMEIGKEEEMDIYLYTGGKELGKSQLDRQVVNNNYYMADLLKESGFSSDEVKLVVDPKGTQDEKYWSKWFENGLLWLYKK